MLQLIVYRAESTNPNLMCGAYSLQLSLAWVCLSSESTNDRVICVVLVLGRVSPQPTYDKWLSAASPIDRFHGFKATSESDPNALGLKLAGGCICQPASCTKLLHFRLMVEIEEPLEGPVTHGLGGAKGNSCIHFNPG